jgi:pyridoxamine 5'-phosphate oxidase
LGELERRAAQLARELGVDTGTDRPAPGRRLARPGWWGGYRLWLDAVELWAEGASRFHERLQYRRALTPDAAIGFAAGPWQSERLQP